MCISIVENAAWSFCLCLPHKLLPSSCVRHVPGEVLIGCWLIVSEEEAVHFMLTVCTRYARVHTEQKQLLCRLSCKPGFGLKKRLGQYSGPSWRPRQPAALRPWHKLRLRQGLLLRLRTPFRQLAGKCRLCKPRPGHCVKFWHARQLNVTLC